ncbi:MAG: FG-GAP repeat protein [Pleurocapsa minor HA4230-MV1]|nr:FG-GAP repeat protein [Pleurocapsa minor HA4230-MV1]
MAISLSDLKNTNGNDGLVIPGKNEGDRLGEAVYSAGDLNGDGLDDLVVTAPDGGIPSTDDDSYYQSDRRGQAYVIFGTRSSNNSTVNLDSLNGSNGFKVSGIDATNQLGSAVSVGDLNGDGIDDLVLGAPNAGRNISSYNYSYSENNGEAYVIFGTRNGKDANFNLQSLNGSNGFTLKGIDASDLLGTAITSAGDINGDGIDDLAVSATGGGQPITNRNGFTYSDRRGEVYVLFGKKNGFDARINLFNLNGSNGFIVDGKDANDSLGSALSNAGDINGDGIDDLVIGASNAGNVIDSPFADGDSDRRGEIYVVFGSKNGFNSRFSVGDRFTLTGIGIEDNLGTAISSAGDLNGDGIDDLVIGAANASVDGSYTQSGQVYVLFGRQGGFGTQFDLNSLNGNNGFSIAGINGGDGLGNAVSAGDFNGDDIDDLLVGASTAGSDSRGAAYVLFGKRNGFTSQVDLANLSSSAGIKIAGVSSEDLLGSGISSGGDLNGDGADDLIVSAPGVDLGNEYTKEGTTYVIFGKPQPQPQPVPSNSPTPYSDRLKGTAQNDQISGQNGDDTIFGEDGNDTLAGDGGNDRLSGSNGNDTLAGNDGGDTISGGAGTDLLNGGNQQDRLLGDAGNDSLVGGTDNDLLEGGSGNDTIFGADPNNFQVQVGEQETLIGGEGTDLFILGDKNQIYYDDRNSRTDGSTDYALIEDFNLAQDKIQLKGDRSLYSLSFFADGNGKTLANLFYLQPEAVPERVGILKNVSSNLTLSNSAFVFVGQQPSNPPPTTIIGQATPYNDRLNGTAQNDQISGQNGNDTIFGEDGNDTLAGDGGNDRLSGSNGNDTLAGNDGGDTISGGAGTDLLNGGNQQDRLLGDAGNDSLVGGTDNDLLEGGSGNDTLFGADPNNSQVQVGEQETLIGGEGTDLFILGDKNQIYYDDRNSRTDGSTDYALIEDFNSAQDKIQLKGDRSLYSLSFFADGNGQTLANLYYLQPGATAERVGILKNVSSNLTLSNSAFIYLPNESPQPAFNLIGGATPYNDKLKGSVLNDQISGNSGDDNISGGDGNDSLAGDGGGDSLFGDSGNDTVNGGNNNDNLYGAAGNDLLDGGNNQDQLSGDDGNDTLNGGTDNDFLTGGIGNDTLNGTNPNNFELQLGEQDTLVGGADRDLFILGDKDRLYYSDRNSRTDGSTDYAVIKDFNPAQDQIQLKGDRRSYNLSFFTGANGNTLASILYLEAGSTPERIGIIEDVSPDLTINNSAFTFI